MKLKVTLIVLLALVAAVSAGCGLIGGGSSGTVSSLWSDVPQMPNSTKANINMPPLVSILIQGFMAAANSDKTNDAKLDKFDFVIYQTADSPEQVTNFYTVDKMKSAGWTGEESTGCAGGAESGTGAGFCVFVKQDSGNNKGTVLMVIPVKDDQTKQTQIIYVRFEASKKT
jgi:hypothetical protein